MSTQAGTRHSLCQDDDTAAWAVAECKHAAQQRTGTIHCVLSHQGDLMGEVPSNIQSVMLVTEMRCEATQPTVRLVSLVSLVQTRPSPATRWSPHHTVALSIAVRSCSDHSSKLGVVNLPPREARHYQHHCRYTDTRVSCRYCAAAAASLSCFVVSKSFKIR